jgi:ribosomal 50S subunit-associated protein YjgA (DUF615 family)
MSDREMKIAEIQKSAEEARKTKGTWVDGQDYADDVEFLLNELERLEREYAEERAAHNAHVMKLCELEQERDKLIEGLRIATDVLGTVPMNDARLWGVYNKLCDILKEIGVMMNE